VSISSRPSPRRPSLLEFNVQVLKREDLLVDEVEKILSMPSHNARSVIGGTSSTAYRRVHEIVASALDRLAGSAQRDLSLLVDLSKALILIRYQAARGQISDALANYIDDVIRGVIDTAKASWEEAKRVARNARTLLDALAVLVYEYT